MGFLHRQSYIQNKLIRLAFTRFILLFSLCVGPVFAVQYQGPTPEQCSPVLTKVFGAVIDADGQPKEQLAKHRKIETLDGLLLAFTEGFEPDLSIPAQRDAFEVYRKMRFGNPNTNLTQSYGGPSINEKLVNVLKKHPELRKEPFRNFKISTQERVYAVTESVKTFLDSQIKSAGQVRSNLFQVDANKGYWKKVFQYKEPMKFEEFLDTKIPKETRTALLNAKEPVIVRSKTLYEILTKERLKLKSEGKDIRPISQAIVDLIHGLGYQDPLIAKNLKSEDGLERLNAFRKILEERDKFAESLGFPGHFEQALKDFQILQPSGTPTVQLAEKLQTLEAEILKNVKILENSGSVKTIRHLSQAESPYRSCIGGGDCSSRTYLTKALDPNYHYFTITDSEGFSSGHITVVLGEAQNKSTGKKEKLAFVDKIQNVDNVDLPTMAEGVRRSVLEKGYTLVIPDKLDGPPGEEVNGISNEPDRRAFIKRNIHRDEDIVYKDFKPHAHNYSFEDYASRVQDNGKSVRPVLALKEADGIKITAAELTHPWKTSDFSLEKLVAASIKLKHGDVEDKVRYISSMKTLEQAGLKTDAEYHETLEAWLGDPLLPFKLRKQVLLTKWVDNNEPLSKLLSHFDVKEQEVLIQNFLDTPRYRKVIVPNKKELPSLMVHVRENKKVREALIAEYSPDYHEPITKILEAKDIPQEHAVAAIKQVESSFSATEIAKVIEIQKQLKGTSLEPWLETSLVSHYLKNIHSNGALGRGLSLELESTDPSLQSFGTRLLRESLKNESQRFPILKAYGEILELQRKDGLPSLHEASQRWLSHSEVTPSHKAEFLMTQMGTGKSQFRDFLKNVPQSQRDLVLKEIEKGTSIPLFKKLAKKQGLESILFDHGVIESFQFKSIITAEQAKNGGVTFTMGEGEEAHQVTLTEPFDMQVTPLTHLQILLTTGNNPSKFTVQGFEVEAVVNGVKKKVKIDPNRPAESFSWDDEEVILQALNDNDPNYTYRRPTNAEWECAARGRTTTKYSFGDRDEDMIHHGWTHENSGGQTHPVAQKRPNGYGGSNLVDG